MISPRDSKSNTRRVVVIGFDGATLDLIEPWAEAGILPTFKRLMKQGTYGSLESTMPPVTPAAWSSLATGMKQGKHGLFDFFARKENSYETYVVNATNRHGTPLWQLLSQSGYRTTVFNVPATYPPDPVNGLMVSGLLTPTHAADAAWPNNILDELKHAVPEFSFYPPGIFSKGQEAEFVNKVLAWDRMTLKATEYLMNRQAWDFLFTVFIGVDIMSHFMWQEMVTQSNRPAGGAPEMQETLANAIQNVYRQADDILAKLLEAVGEDTYVVIVSDHGFGPLDYYVHLNAWLVQKGYLKFKRNPWVIMKYLAYRLGITPLNTLELLRKLGLGGRVQQTASEKNAWLKAMVKQFFLAFPDVDWSRTTAYSAGYGGPIFVNLKGRHPQGIVEPGEAYETLIANLKTDLRAVRHPHTNEPFIGDIFRPQDLYSGPFVEQAPDLLALPYDWSNQGYGVHDFASNRWLEPSPDRSGTHRMNGIFYMYGPEVRPGFSVEGAALWDIAPTILALMGVPIPKNMDGQVLSVAMSDTLKSNLSIRYCEPVEGISKQPPASPDMSDEDEQAIRERLEALGYVG